MGCSVTIDGWIQHFTDSRSRRKVQPLVSEIQNLIPKNGTYFFLRSSEEIVTKTDFKLVLLEIKLLENLVMHMPLPPQAINGLC